MDSEVKDAMERASWSPLWLREKPKLFKKRIVQDSLFMEIAITSSLVAKIDYDEKYFYYLKLWG